MAMEKWRAGRVRWRHANRQPIREKAAAAGPTHIRGPPVFFGTPWGPVTSPSPQWRHVRPPVWTGSSPPWLPSKGRTKSFHDRNTFISFWGNVYFFFPIFPTKPSSASSSGVGIRRGKKCNKQEPLMLESGTQETGAIFWRYLSAVFLLSVNISFVARILLSSRVECHISSASFDTWCLNGARSGRNAAGIPEESRKNLQKGTTKKKLIHSRDGGRGRGREEEEEDEIVDADDVWMNVTLCYWMEARAEPEEADCLPEALHIINSASEKLHLSASSHRLGGICFEMISSTQRAAPRAAHLPPQPIHHPAQSSLDFNDNNM